jgi:hypothetical protein
MQNFDCNSFFIFSVLLTINIFFLLLLPDISRIQPVYAISDPLFCSSKHLMDCYFKILFKISNLNTGEKPSDFKIHISDNPRHVDDFVMSNKIVVRYLLPGAYRISAIFKDQNQGYFCVGIAKAHETRVCNNIKNIYGHTIS